MRLRWRGVDAPTLTKHWQEWYETHIGAKWPPRARHKKQVKIGPATPSTRISATSVRKFGPGAFPNRFWRGSGDSHLTLGWLLGALGCLLGALGRLLNSSWASLGRSWEAPGCHMLPKRGPGWILEGSGSVPVIFRSPQNCICQCFFELSVIMLLMMQSPRFCISLPLFFFPSGAAVCAQHMESVAPLDGAQACQNNMICIQL